VLFASPSALTTKCVQFPPGVKHTVTLPGLYGVRGIGDGRAGAVVADVAIRGFVASQY
jgi:hypothetical protein